MDKDKPFSTFPFPVSFVRGFQSGVDFINMFTGSFYVRRLQKCKNDSNVIGHFMLLGSTCIKAAGKMLTKWTSGSITAGVILISFHVFTYLLVAIYS
jgi:hypothetical protein